MARLVAALILLPWSVVFFGLSFVLRVAGR